VRSNEARRQNRRVLTMLVALFILLFLVALTRMLTR